MAITPLKEIIIVLDYYTLSLDNMCEQVSNIVNCLAY